MDGHLNRHVNDGLDFTLSISPTMTFIFFPRC